ncbi:MAG: hypothetical protein ACP5QV_08640, partial [Athalassotoga sp.]|uniref:hypothetical protein n=1 Tax=Athalassotoga sp. TaxID=2022597 RepID=UPI003D015104
ISSESYKLVNRNRIILAKKYLTCSERIRFYIFLFATRGIIFIKYLMRGKLINTFSGIKEGFKYKV